LVLAPQTSSTGGQPSVADLVHVRTYLADRSHREVNSHVRRDVLGAHEPALTVVMCDLFEPGWVAEIEAVARVPRAGD
jgi:2-iminobutanoate/2-iminopropanoate deaminase